MAAAAAAGKSNNETDVMYTISVACGRRQRQTAAHLLGNHRTSGADSHPHRLSARSRDHDSEIMPRAYRSLYSIHCSHRRFEFSSTRCAL